MSRLSSARSGIPSRGQRSKSLGQHRLGWIIFEPRLRQERMEQGRRCVGAWREGSTPIRTKYSCVRMSVFEREWIKATIEKRA